MRRQIPRFVLARNRQNSYADEQAGGYPNRPAKPDRGPCQLCNKPEVDHGLGLCDDLRSYTPKKPVEAAR